MPLKSEIMRVVRHVDETGEGSITAVRNLWPVKLTVAEREELLKEALAARVSVALRSSASRGRLERAEAEEAGEPETMEIEVAVTPRKASVVTINVEILERVTLDVHGERRKMIDLTIEDTEFLLNRAEGFVRGALRWARFHRYIHDKLEETGAATVGTLGVREQRTIAGMLEAIEKREEPEGLPAPGNIRKLAAGR